MAQSPEFRIFEDLLSFLPGTSHSKQRKALQLAEHQQSLRAIENANRAADDVSAQSQARTTGFVADNTNQATANANIKAGNAPETLRGLAANNQTRQTDQGEERNRLQGELNDQGAARLDLAERVEGRAGDQFALDANAVENQQANLLSQLEISQQNADSSTQSVATSAANSGLARDQFNQNTKDNRIDDLTNAREVRGAGPVTSQLMKELGIELPTAPEGGGENDLVSAFTAQQDQRDSVSSEGASNFWQSNPLSGQGPAGDIVSDVFDFVTPGLPNFLQNQNDPSYAPQGLQAAPQGQNTLAVTQGQDVMGVNGMSTQGQTPMQGEAPQGEGGILQALAQMVLGNVGDDVNAQRQQAQTNMQGAGGENSMLDEIMKMLQAQPQTQMFR